MKSISKNKFIPVNLPKIFKQEKTYLKKCLDTGWISSQGPMVGKFEEKISAWCSRKYGVSMMNGSCALVAAVHSLNLPKGSELLRWGCRSKRN